jgi:hypothetical protein
MDDASQREHDAPPQPSMQPEGTADVHAHAIDLAAKLAARVTRESTHELRLARVLMLDVVELLGAAFSSGAQERHVRRKPCAALPLQEENL